MKTLQESLLGDNIDKQTASLGKDIELSKYFNPRTAQEAWEDLYDTFAKNKKNEIITGTRWSSVNQKLARKCITLNIVYYNSQIDVDFTDYANRPYGLSLVIGLEDAAPSSKGVNVYKMMSVPKAYSPHHKSIQITRDFQAAMEAMTLLDDMVEYCERNKLFTRQ